MAEKTRICFVCLGNIVRSPLAENLFEKLAAEQGVSDQFVLDSAGTGGWHIGEAPDSRMRKVAAERGLRYSGRARQFAPSDFQHFDLVIAMDPDNRRSLIQLARSDDDRVKIRLMREFDSETGKDLAVPDPYYGGVSGFERTYDIIERSCRGLLSDLEAGAI